MAAYAKMATAERMAMEVHAFRVFVNMSIYEFYFDYTFIDLITFFIIKD